MKKSRVALVVLLGAAIVVTGVSIAAFSAADNDKANKTARTAQLSDKSMAASVRTQIEKPLSHGRGAITNLQKITDEANHIALKWDPVSDAKGYNVYICDRDDESQEYKKIADVTEPTVDIQDLKDTTPYWIKVSAYINDGLSTVECPAALLKTATQTADVAGLDSTHSGDVIGFEWNENSRYTGYEIYRGSKSNDYQYELYEKIDNRSSEYEDQNVEDGEFYTYMIKPFRIVDDTQYTAPGKTIDLMCGLSSPSDFIARKAGKSVVLSWKDRPLAQGYNIYQAQGEHGDYKMIDTTENTSYTVENLTANTTYFFRVQPYHRISDEKTAYGTWSTCSVEVTDGEQTSGSAITSKGTYIEISIQQQHLWLYVDGKMFLDTDVVTGNDDDEHYTPTGNFSIIERGQGVNLEGEGYSTYVNYWMCFLGGGYGIHDADWRSSFGGDIYQGNGSHGCVNTPYDKVQQIYEHTEYGTPVYIY